MRGSSVNQKHYSNVGCLINGEPGNFNNMTNIMQIQDHNTTQPTTQNINIPSSNDSLVGCQQSVSRPIIFYKLNGENPRLRTVALLNIAYIRN